MTDTPHAPATGDRPIDRPDVAYVMTHHPRVAMTFIAGELAEIQRLGGRITPIAMNSPAAEDVATPEGAAARAETLYLKEQGIARLAITWAAVTARHPVAMARLVRTAVASARLDPKLIIRRLVHLVYAATAVRRCRARGVRHLHAHFGQSPSTIAWFTAEIGNMGRGPRWTWSFTIHGFQDFVDETIARLDLKAASATFVVCISDFTRSQLCRITDPRLWDRFHVVRCGIDLEAFAPRAPRPMREVPRVLVVARLSAEKGHPVLLEAARILRERGTRIEVEIVGSGPYEPEIREQAVRSGIADDVHFLGELQPAEVAVRLADADVFCLPSFNEGLPVSIMEAMAVGVPVVSTCISGIPELAVHHETALTVPAANATALADALALLVRDPSGSAPMRDDLVRAARSAVERDHDVHTNVARLAALFAAARRADGTGEH